MKRLLGPLAALLGLYLLANIMLGGAFAYTRGKYLLAKGDMDWDEAAGDFRVLLVMSNTTADTEEDKTTISGFTTLDEYDGANYARVALANQVVAEDTVNNRGEMSADAWVYTALGVGTRQAVGMVIFKFVTNDADSVPYVYNDTGGFPFDGNGGNVTITPNAEGLIQTT